MTQEELQAMPRKEWRAYCKRMKALDKKSKEFPERTTIAELKIKWTAFKACDTLETVLKRTQPYIGGHEQYLKALKGG